MREYAAVVQGILKEQMAERLVHQVRQDGSDHRYRNRQRLALPPVDRETDEGADEQVAQQEHDHDMLTAVKKCSTFSSNCYLKRYYLLAIIG